MFTLGGKELPVLRWEDHYRYLGCEIGANPRAELHIEQTSTIMRSKLIIWQKIDVLKHFVQPRLEFSIRTLLPTRGWAKYLERNSQEGTTTAKENNNSLFVHSTALGRLGAPEHRGRLGCGLDFPGIQIPGE